MGSQQALLPFLCTFYSLNSIHITARFLVRFGGMMLVALVLVAVCFAPATGIHCEDDKILDGADAKEYTQKVPHVGDMDYWRTAQNNFQVFGTWDGDASNSVITAAYYTEDDNLIFGITIDCGK